VQSDVGRTLIGKTITL